MHDRHELDYCLSLIDPDLDRGEWIEIAAAMMSENYQLEDFIEWSRGGSKFKGVADCRTAWASIKGRPRCNYQTLFYYAHRSGKFVNLRIRDPEKWEAFRRKERSSPTTATPRKIASPRAAQAGGSPSALPRFQRGSLPTDRERQPNTVGDKEKQLRAAKSLERLLASALPASADHPYLERKRIDPYGLYEVTSDSAIAILGYTPKIGDQKLQAGRYLIVPLHAGDGIPQSAELIDETGRKCSLAHLPRVGLMFSPTHFSSLRACSTIAIAEGMATARTIDAIGGIPTLSAGSCANLTNVAKTVRVECPGAAIIVFGDRGEGQAEAEKAADSVYGWAVFPDAELLPPGGTDFNDLFLHAGDEIAYEAINRARIHPRQVTFASARTRMPIDCVLPGLMCGTVGLIAGAGGIGKSYLAAELCASIALGRSLSGIPVFRDLKPGKAAILFGEDDPKIINNRFHDMVQHYGLREEDIETLDRDVLTLSCVGEDMSMLTVTNRDVIFTNFVLQLRTLCAGRRVVIIDPLSRLHTGDENDNMLASQLMTALSRVAFDTQCSILVLHHFGKGDRSDWAASRGASAFTTAARWQLNIAAPTKDEVEAIKANVGAPGAAESLIKVAVVKSNYGPKYEFWMIRNSRGVLSHVELELGDELQPIARPPLGRAQTTTREPPRGQHNHRRAAPSRDWAYLGQPSTPDDIETT